MPRREKPVSVSPARKSTMTRSCRNQVDHVDLIHRNNSSTYPYQNGFMTNTATVLRQSSEVIYESMMVTEHDYEPYATSSAYTTAITSVESLMSSSTFGKSELLQFLL